MKVTGSRASGFRPITLTVVLESEEEVKAIKELTAKNLTIPNGIAAGSIPPNYEGVPVNAGPRRAMYEFLTAIHDTIKKEQNNG